MAKKFSMCDFFFGENGKLKVQRLLRDSICKARWDSAISPKKLDEICLFTEDGMPTCKEFEKDPSLITNSVFCRADCALELKIDEVLDLDYSEDNLGRVIQFMEENNSGVAHATTVDGEEAGPITARESAPMFAAFQIISELG